MQKQKSQAANSRPRRQTMSIFSLLLTSILLFGNSNPQDIDLFGLPEMVPSLLGGRMNPQSQCRSIKGLGSPINIFRLYFQQTINNFFVESSQAKVVLIYYRESREKVSTHRYIFSVRNVYSKKTEFIGIMGIVPPLELDKKKYKQFVIRYINSRSFDNVKALLGVHNAEKESHIPCTKMRDTLIKKVVEDPIMPYTCFSSRRSNCVNKQQIQSVFRASFDATSKILAQFGFNVKMSDLIFNKRILSVLKKVYRPFDFLKRDLAILMEGVSPEREVDHDQLVRTSYTGGEARCKDILDIHNKCANRSNLKKGCITYSQSVKLRNLLIVFYMVDRRTILSIQAVKGNFEYLLF